MRQFLLLVLTIVVCGGCGKGSDTSAAAQSATQGVPNSGVPSPSEPQQAKL